MIYKESDSSFESWTQFIIICTMDTFPLVTKSTEVYYLAYTLHEVASLCSLNTHKTDLFKVDRRSAHTLRPLTS